MADTLDVQPATADYPPFPVALMQLARLVEEAKAAHAAPQAAPRLGWGQGNPRHPDYAAPRPRDVLDETLARERLRASGFDPETLPLTPERPVVHAGGLPTGFERPQAELRNTNEPAADWIAQHANPEAGRRAQQFLNTGRALEATPGVGEMVRTGEQMTGAPAVAHGGLNVRQGLEEGSPWRVAGGAAEMGAGAIPAAAGVRALRPAVGSTAGILGGTAAMVAGDVLPGYAEDVKMKSPRQLQIEQFNSELKSLQDQRNEIIKKNPQPSFSRDPDRGKTQREAYDAKLKTLTAPYDTQIAGKMKDIGDANAGLLSEQQGERPFRQQYPGASRIAQGVGEFGPAAIAWRGGVTTRNNISQAIRAYETAVASRDPVALAAAQDLLQKYTGETWKQWGLHKGATVAGGLGGSTLANIVPELSDLSSETQHDQALKKLTFGDPAYTKERALQIGVGGVLGPIVGEEVGRLAPGLANYQKAKAYSTAEPFANRAAVAPPVQRGGGGGNNGGGGNGPLMLGPGAWPPEARRAAREYMATTGLADPLAVRPSDVTGAMARRGIIANETNVGTRLTGTQSYLSDPQAPVSTPPTWADVMNSPAQWKGRRLLSAAPAAAIPGTVLDRDQPLSPADSQSPDRTSRTSPETGPQSLPPTPETSTSRSTSSSPDLPEGHSLTPWGIRGPGGKFTKSPDSSSSIVAPKGEQKPNPPYSRPGGANGLLDLMR